MTWMRSRFAPIGSFSAATRKARRFALRCGAEVAAHRDALGVADPGRHAVVRVARLEIPPAEEAHDHARAGGGVGLAPLHGVEDRLARILGRPHRGIAGRGLLPAHDDGLVRLDERMRCAVRAWFGGRRLAEEIILLDRREAGVRIGAADQAELVGVHPEFGFHLETVLERRACVLEFQHLRLLHFGEIEVALVPALEVREFIVGRQKRMRLAVALDLRGLVKRLPTHAVLGIFAVDPPAGERLDDREHAAVAQIAVVREGEDFGAGLFFGHRHPLPQVARIGTAERRQSRVGLDEAGLGPVVAPDDIAMKIVSAGVRCPLIADEGGETARLVRLLRRLDRPRARRCDRRACPESETLSASGPGRSW